MQVLLKILKIGPGFAWSPRAGLLLFSAFLCGGPLDAAVARLLVLNAGAGENVEPVAARAFFRRFGAKLRSTGLVDITTLRTGPLADRAASCGKIACAAAIARELKVGRVLLAWIRKPGRDYVAEIVVVTAAGGKVEIRVVDRLPSLEPEDRERGSERMARAMEAEMRRRGYRPRRRLTTTERWLTLLPGAGQYLTGNYRRSGFFITAGFLTLQNYLNARHEHRRAREQFQDLNVPAAIALGLRNEPQLSLTINTLYGAEARDNLDARARSGNIAFLLLGGLLVWNFLDAENDYEYFSAEGPRKLDFRLTWCPGDFSPAGVEGTSEGGRFQFVLRATF